MRYWEAFLKLPKSKGGVIKFACFAPLNNVKENEIVGIYKVNQKETSQYIELIVQLINKITDCKYDAENDCIEYKMLKGFNRNLILLNFIRYLWFSPLNNEASTVFFKKLSDLFNNTNINDPLVLLTIANRYTAKVIGYVETPTHCNYYHYSYLQIRKTNELLNCNFNSTKQFLCSKF